MCLVAEVSASEDPVNIKRLKLIFVLHGAGVEDGGLIKIGVKTIW